MITCNCCAHCWTQSTKYINLPRAHNCEKIEIKNRTGSNDGINGKTLKREWWECCCIPQEGGWNKWLWQIWLRSLEKKKIDTGKWYCASRGAVSIKVHRGLLSVCEKLINTKVSFIRPPSCRSSHITSRAGNKARKKRSILSMYLQTSGLHADSE